MKVLLYGYGNPGRQDDGLGNTFVDRIESWINEEKLDYIEIDSNYQLNIEDAEVISNYDLVIFIDASVEDIKDFCLVKVTKATEVIFTTHAASPGYIVDLCKQIYSKAPPTYLLHLKGFEWAFKEGLTEKAEQILNNAIKYMKPILKDPQSLIDGTTEIKDCNL